MSLDYSNAFNVFVMNSPGFVNGIELKTSTVLYAVENTSLLEHM